MQSHIPDSSLVNSVSYRAKSKASNDVRGKPVDLEVLKEVFTIMDSVSPELGASADSSSS